MIAENFSIHAGRSTQIYCQSLRPENPPKAALFVVHGLGEHGGRYEEIAAHFIKNGIAVFTFDHRGHGRSGGKRGHAQSIDQLIEDTEFALMKCRSIFLEIPIYIFGHSMGGQITATFLKKVKSKELSGAIISSAWFELVNPPPPWQIKLINGVKGFFPDMTLSNGLNPSNISSVAREVELYQKDELIHDKISFTMFNTLYNNGLKLLTEHKKAKIPVLICHGDGDMITSCDASQKYARNLGEKAEFNIWAEAYHEPHHDKSKAKVFDFYAEWILSKIS